ncbi:trehalose-phosphatase [Altererythrobacter palmitatis]|uniref:trehalose-phosphatase n=1 Tax=Alteraurantiacibacter palmitatis TaxID=2054628 RepID=UPI003019BEEC
MQQHARIGLFLDFDGTLVELAPGPDAIAVPADLAVRLERLGERLGGALALVSGRSAADLRRHLGPGLLTLAGSHGAHIVAPDGSVLRQGSPLPGAVSEHLRLFASRSGLLFEEKAHGGALHYRARPELGDQATDFAKQLAQHHGLATKEGKCVIELVWPGADKGGAAHLLCGNMPFAGTIPVFIGDDITDEDGFAACIRMGGFGIKVGEGGATCARYRLASVKDVFAWLNL